jgi:ElaB/YqjD/DUF883 family membrane-anchored ribosome-binding protein
MASKTSHPFDRSASELAGADSIADRVTEAKEKVADLARTAADTIDDKRSSAAAGLSAAASTLHEKAESLPGGDGVQDFAHATADRLSSTATYVREHDMNRMMADVEELVTRNPGPSLLAAAAFGFLLGHAVTRA